MAANKSCCRPQWDILQWVLIEVISRYKASSTLDLIMIPELFITGQGVFALDVEFSELSHFRQ